MLHGIAFGFGFFLAMFICIVFLVFLVAILKNTKKKPKFTVEAFQQYARTLLANEQYNELNRVKEIVKILHDGKTPDAKLLDPYDVKIKTKLKVKGSSISVDKKQIIFRKPGFDKKQK